MLPRKLIGNGACGCSEEVTWRYHVDLLGHTKSKHLKSDSVKQESWTKLFAASTGQAFIEEQHVSCVAKYRCRPAGSAWHYKQRPSMKSGGPK